MTRDFDGAGRAAPFKESFDGGEPLERRLPAQLDHRQREDTAPKRSREGADGFPGQENRRPDLGVRGPDLGGSGPDLGGVGVGAGGRRWAGRAGRSTRDS